MGYEPLRAPKKKVEMVCFLSDKDRQDLTFMGRNTAKWDWLLVKTTFKQNTLIQVLSFSFQSRFIIKITLYLMLVVRPMEKILPNAKISTKSGGSL